MAKKITIKKAATKDIPAIVELWKELMDFHKKLDPLFTRSSTGHKQFAEFLKSHIRSKDSLALVAADGDCPVGYCLIKISKYPPVFKRHKFAELSDLAVTDKYRRKGIGKRFIKTAKQWYVKRGIDRIEARYSTENGIAAGFWAKVGFRPYLKTTFLEI